MKLLRSIICLVLCALFCVGCAAPEGERMETKLTQYVIRQAEYPVYPAFVNAEDYFRADGAWDSAAYEQAEKEAAQALQNMGKTGSVNAAALLTFADATAGRALQSRDGANGVYSPVSLYVAMAMLAELCDGESQAQVLRAMGAEDLESLRQEIRQLWLESYCDNSVVTSRMGGSLWLNEQVAFNEDVLQTLADNYFASSYRVAMGTEAADQAIGQWINEQTGNLLETEAGNIRTKVQTLLQMYSTLYFKARWKDTFLPELTEKGLFHLYDADGASVECDFMHRESTGACRRGEGYTAAMLPFTAGGGYMTFCLPDSDTNVDALLQSDTLISELGEMDEYGNIIRWTVPKFDVSATMGLNELMKELGAKAVFDAQAADFTTLTEVPAYLDSVRQAARVKIDEEGVEAAAFTEMAICGASLPIGVVEMKLDRPFIFAIYDQNGLPLFVGTVLQPE